MEPFLQHSKEDIYPLLSKIFKRAGHYSKIYVDAELDWTKKWFDPKKMLLIWKSKGQHVSIAENRIQNVKK